MTRLQLRLTLLALVLGITGCAQGGPAAPPPVTANSAGASVPPASGSADQDRLVIPFAAGSDRLMPAAGQQLDTAARLFRDVRPVSMFSVGYSDGAGEEFSNLLLSARRARTVKAALVARGIPANQVYIRAFGSSAPIDKVNPDAPENRRVVVTWDTM